MDVYSARLHRVFRKGQKLKDTMLEIQRLRRLINLAEAEVRSRHQHGRHKTEQPQARYRYERRNERQFSLTSLRGGFR